MKDLNNKELVEISGGSEIGDAVLCNRLYW